MATKTVPCSVWNREMFLATRNLVSDTIVILVNNLEYVLNILSDQAGTLSLQVEMGGDWATVQDIYVVANRADQIAISHFATKIRLVWYSNSAGTLICNVGTVRG